MKEADYCFFHQPDAKGKEKVIQAAKKGGKGKRKITKEELLNGRVIKNADDLCELMNETLSLYNQRRISEATFNSLSMFCKRFIEILKQREKESSMKKFNELNGNDSSINLLDYANLGLYKP